MTATSQRLITYLLVEDNDDHADIVQRCLTYKKLPSRIRRVRSGTECLAYLGGEDAFGDRNRFPYPDVVLLDIRMPGLLDGLQTLKAIRADRRHASLPVMMLTTSDRDLDVSRAYKLGANGYIVKSDDTGQLIKKLLQLHYSFETLVKLPENQQERPAGPPAPSAGRHPPGDLESFLQADHPTAFRMLTSSYRQDPGEALSWLLALEQTNTARFARLATRFCLEHAELLAIDRQVDWIFLREVVIEKLPRYTELGNMTAVVAGVATALERVPVSREDPSWPVWQGFCQAYLNQDRGLAAECDEEDRVASSPAPHSWKGVAVTILAALIGLVAGVLIRSLF